MSHPVPHGLGTRLRRLLAALDNGVQAVYDARGMRFRPRFYAVTVHLLAEECSSVGALAALTGVSQPAMSQTLAEMLQQDLITIITGPDPRTRQVRLSAHGQAMAQQLEQVWAATTAAAAALDAELPMPLGALVAAAEARLEAQNFAVRILQQMEPR